jgi:hypothetical protein
MKQKVVETEGNALFHLTTLMACEEKTILEKLTKNKNNNDN